MNMQCSSASLNGIVLLGHNGSDSVVPHSLLVDKAPQFVDCVEINRFGFV